MAVTLTVSIPSTLASREGWCDLPTPEDKQIRRLLETGLPQATCPLCGTRATVETVTVHRPGQTSVLRRVLRCWRQVPTGLRSNGPQGTRCPAQVLGEAPLDGEFPADLAPERAHPVAERAHPVGKACADCGDVISPQATWCPPCKRRRDMERLRARGEANKRPCVDCGTPCTGQRCRACHHASRILPDCAPPPLEAPEGPRACCDCGRDISDRQARALRCVDCAGDHRRRERRAWRRRRRGQTGEAPDLPPESPQEACEHTTLPEPPSDQPEPTPSQPEAESGHEEESMPNTTRTCCDCGGRAKYCEVCAAGRKRLQDRESRQNAKADPAPCAIAPPSRALRVSVLDIAALVRCLEPSARALVEDILSLSPERGALLRQVLADAEEVCA